MPQADASRGALAPNSAPTIVTVPNMCRLIMAAAYNGGRQGARPQLTCHRGRGPCCCGLVFLHVKPERAHAPEAR